MDSALKGRMLRLLVLLWLGWYLWGPVDPVVDWWDTPSQTMSDMVRAAGGVVALIGAGLATALLQSRKLGKRFRMTSKTAPGIVACLFAPAVVMRFSTSFQGMHGPPVPLRI
ncbi:MAG: hypothetical protein EPN47_16710 [Acidobacteria bacterium]|nr:MAG: hypothetical protein EPN47_16710 [Acidobacteriota bacterium]